MADFIKTMLLGAALTMFTGTMACTDDAATDTQDGGTDGTTQSVEPASCEDLAATSTFDAIQRGIFERHNCVG